MNAGLEEAVLITGVYGSGKSSVAQEIAYLLEKGSVPYALLDLDFLGWADTGDGGRTVWLGVMLRNLAALVGNYLEVGVRFFVLAGAIRDLAELEALKAELSMPLRVVRLTVPLQEIADRLRPDGGQARRPARGGLLDRDLRGGRRRGLDGLERPSDPRGSDRCSGVAGMAGYRRRVEHKTIRRVREATVHQCLRPKVACRTTLPLPSGKHRGR